MARYRIDDDDNGTSVVLTTEKATGHWPEDTRWNGNNHISCATGSQWEHETLYRSSKGRYWIEYTSQWQGSTPSARLVTTLEAAAWLMANDYAVTEMPPDLQEAAAQISE